MGKSRHNGKGAMMKKYMMALVLGTCLSAPALATGNTAQDNGAMAADALRSVKSDAYQSQASEKPANEELAKFFEQAAQEDLDASPITKSYRGIKDEDYGSWGDFGDDADLTTIGRSQAQVARLKAMFDPATLNESDAMSYRLFLYQANRNLAASAFRKDGYLFDQMNGAQSFLPTFLINIHSVANVDQAKDYIKRLNGVKPAMDAMVAESGERADNGVIVPDWVFPYVIDDSKNVIKGAPFEKGGDSILFKDIKAKVAALDISDSEKAALVADAEKALLDSVGSAYRSLIAEMERQQAMAKDGDGVWRFPDGEQYYKERLNYYTSTNLTADEIHQIGLDNVARIHGEMRNIMKKTGFKGNLQEFFEYLRSDDKFFYTKREDYLADADKHVQTITKALPEFFNILPKADLVVKPVEAYREKSAGKAFYNNPAEDGSRPGTYYVNLYNLRDMSKTELEALVYHEGLPGHHMQRSIQMELKGLPTFRRYFSMTAYTEGWGLYSEELGKDMGFYEDPYSDFGRLGMELWRACRLVVDTGLHHKRWSREEAMAYLKENTPNPDGDIRKAIERYSVYPGQATAYMIGKLKIMELRGKAQTALGDKFTFGDFHDVVLRSGPVPLDILEENIDQWIAQSR